VGIIDVIHIYLKLNFLAIQHYVNHERESENLIIFILLLNNLQNNNSESQYNFILNTSLENIFQSIFKDHTKNKIHDKAYW